MKDEVTKRMLFDALTEMHQEIREVFGALSKIFNRLENNFDSIEGSFDTIEKGFEEAKQHREMLHKKTKELIQECADERRRRMTYR